LADFVTLIQQKQKSERKRSGNNGNNNNKYPISAKPETTTINQVDVNHSELMHLRLVTTIIKRCFKMPVRITKIKTGLRKNPWINCFEYEAVQTRSSDTSHWKTKIIRHKPPRFVTDRLSLRIQSDLPKSDIPSAWKWTVPAGPIWPRFYF